MALPLFASILLGTVASKVVPKFATEKLGMDPTGAALLGAAAGFGAGAYSSGVFSPSGFGAGASMSTPQIAHSVYNPATMAAGSAPVGYNVAAGVVPGFTNAPTTLDKLKAYATSDDQQRYLGNAAATLIEGMMQEKPKQGFLSGGGGGGGGGMAPAYGGGGGGGQVGVTWGFGGNKGGFVPQPIT